MDIELYLSSGGIIERNAALMEGDIVQVHFKKNSDAATFLT